MKKLFAFLFVALLFVGVQDVWAETVDACVNNNNGNTRILAPISNSEGCRNNETPVSWSLNGNGGGGNTMTITGDGGLAFVAHRGTTPLLPLFYWYVQTTKL